MDGGWTATSGSHHFINNRWVESATGQAIDVVDPSDGKAFARIARGTAADTATSDIFILLDDLPSLDFGG